MKATNYLKIIFLLFLLLTPIVIAKEEENEEENSGLAEKLVEALFDFILKIFNAPIKPLVNFVKTLLSASINLNLFKSLWAIIIYTLSLFYSLLLLYSGFTFMVSGYNAIKRENAKEWLRNIIIMMVLVQASFFFYKIMIELSSLLTTAILNMIPQEFFLFESTMELIFILPYLATLLLTTLLLIMRYLIVSFGVVFFPIGIFFYFIPFTKSYGKIILNFLVVCIFLSFFNAIILLCCSKLINIPLFEPFKALVMTSSFLLVSFVTFYFMIFSLIKSAINIGTSVVDNPVSNLAKKVF